MLKVDIYKTLPFLFKCTPAIDMQEMFFSKFFLIFTKEVSNMYESSQLTTHIHLQKIIVRRMHLLIFHEP